MKPAAILASAAVVLTLAAPAAAQHDNQVWTAAFASGPVREGGKVLAWWDSHARFRDEGDHLDTTLLRAGVGWRASPRLDLWAGYAHITQRRPGPDTVEHRAWQQATYPIADLAGGRLTGRTRLEQRFREGTDDTGWRVRQFVRWSRPVASSDFSVVLSNETFVTLNRTDWGQSGGYDQNRAFAGVGWQMTPKFRLEAGYMNQHVDGGSRPDRRNDNIMVSGFTTF
ncbi:DUF2490 domain-containing protein [Brevundimonas subvibrioides]|uniref:DUF2490 domain-containing protein n=1 Tax=Brevundimonas subvibrioides TaxID=74313 RepID=UPI0022B3F98C|nr:DUF2490 domain-containing protein [Brevundimonas subvibrioides]